jgi:hypothetical protein
VSLEIKLRDNQGVLVLDVNQVELLVELNVIKGVVVLIQFSYSLNIVPLFCDQILVADYALLVVLFNHLFPEYVDAIVSLLSIVLYMEFHVDQVSVKGRELQESHLLSILGVDSKEIVLSFVLGNEEHVQFLSHIRVEQTELDVA